AKSSPLDFSLVSVPAVLHRLAEILVSGGSVEEAVNGLVVDTACSEKGLAELLQGFLAKLTASGLMTSIVS
ncbi:hypothetical protein EBR21_08810, partial [bacterium]|nr:hypothetical protein [bacterium]